MIRFAFGVHLHQPVGNFDHVFEQHVREAYLPFLQRAVERHFLPMTLHLSGPLLEWLEAHDTAYLDLVGRLAAQGEVELLLSGFYEPVLAALPREDRLGQIAWMREALARRFGVEARGLWLTERVWEPDLAADLADAGVRYTLLDDRHFLVAGFRRDQLHAPYWTESGGKRVAVFPIDERLRYLIPFRPPADTAAYLRSLRAAGHELAVLADDGEKFGGWPGTRQWVYERGWLEEFFTCVESLVSAGEVRLTTFGDALRDVPSAGIVYLPTASYREMEAWALPRDAAVRLARLERELGEQRVAGPEGAHLRGSHWLSFFVKYPEANRMHKKMQALSALCRARQDPPAARRAIGRAQCNDAYWHGVFGGLYLPHLRAAVWRELGLAEAELRRGEGLVAEVLDLDGDGHDELWIHSGAFSALVSPRRGGAVEEFTVFATCINYADTLTRRREAYHEASHAERGSEGAAQGTPSIHEIERGVRLDEPPPVDLEDRAILVDRVLPAGLAPEDYARGGYEVVRSWARQPMAFDVRQAGDAVEVVLTAHGLEKRLRFTADGRLVVAYQWQASDFPQGSCFAPELSLARPLEFRCMPEPDPWSYTIETVAKSEYGLERTVQGQAVTPRWPVSVEHATIELGFPG